MTKKDYIAIAAALASTRTDPVVTEYQGQTNTFTDCIAQGHWTDTRDAIADVLAADNPAFDRARFIRATEA